jgi:hypothetical protein
VRQEPWQLGAALEGHLLVEAGEDRAGDDAGEVGEVGGGVAELMGLVEEGGEAVEGFAEDPADLRPTLITSSIVTRAISGSAATA